VTAVRRLDAISFFDPLNGWATGFNNLILHTTDGGQAWVLQNVGAPPVNAAGLAEILAAALMPFPASCTFTFRDTLIERVAAEPKRSLEVYLDSGWPRDNYEATCSMCDRPIRKGYRPGTDLSYLDFPEAKQD